MNATVSQHFDALQGDNSADNPRAISIEEIVDFPDALELMQVAAYRVIHAYELCINNDLEDIKQFAWLHVIRRARKGVFERDETKGNLKWFLLKIFFNSCRNAVYQITTRRKREMTMDEWREFATQMQSLDSDVKMDFEHWVTKQPSEFGTVVSHVTEGYSAKEIAKRTSISYYKTESILSLVRSRLSGDDYVQDHIRRAFGKTSAKIKKVCKLEEVTV